MIRCDDNIKVDDFDASVTYIVGRKNCTDCMEELPFISWPEDGDYPSGTSPDYTVVCEKYLNWTTSLLGRDNLTYLERLEELRKKIKTEGGFWMEFTQHKQKVWYRLAASAFIMRIEAIESTVRSLGIEKMSHEKETQCTTCIENIIKNDCFYGGRWSDEYAERVHHGDSATDLEHYCPSATYNSASEYLELLESLINQTITEAVRRSRGGIEISNEQHFLRVQNGFFRDYWFSLTKRNPPPKQQHWMDFSHWFDIMSQLTTETLQTACEIALVLIEDTNGIKFEEVFSTVLRGVVLRTNGENILYNAFLQKNFQSTSTNSSFPYATQQEIADRRLAMAQAYGGDSLLGGMPIDIVQTIADMQTEPSNVAMQTLLRRVELLDLGS